MRVRDETQLPQRHYIFSICNHTSQPNSKKRVVNLQCTYLYFSRYSVDTAGQHARLTLGTPHARKVETPRKGATGGPRRSHEKDECEVDASPQGSPNEGDRQPVWPPREVSREDALAIWTLEGILLGKESSRQMGLLRPAKATSPANKTRETWPTRQPRTCCPSIVPIRRPGSCEGVVQGITPVASVRLVSTYTSSRPCRSTGTARTCQMFSRNHVASAQEKGINEDICIERWDFSLESISHARRSGREESRGGSRFSQGL